MTSIAASIPSVRSPVAKKRRNDFGNNYGYANNKRIKIPPKASQSHSASKSLQTPKKPLTGLEGLLSTDLEFVEATIATEEDEKKRAFVSTQKPTDDEVIHKRREMASKVPNEWGDRSYPAEPGMSNFTGALCYRHSLFQALLHIPNFINWIQIYHSKEDCVADDPSCCISCALRVLSEIYWEGSKSVSLAKLLHFINRVFHNEGWKADTWSEQGDPDEQLQWILKQMRLELTTEAFGYFDAFHNLLMESKISCSKCGHVSRSSGINERYLSIPIKPRVEGNRLTDYIDSYMDEVVRDYRCDNPICKHRSNNHRIQSIAYAPEVLMVQLKRFDFNGNKDNARIVINNHLSLSHHALRARDKPIEYDLIAVIQHAGTTESGHYICHAKGPEGGWAEFDDSFVYESSSQVARRPSDSFTPYLLFYQRTQT